MKLFVRVLWGAFFSVFLASVCVGSAVADGPPTPLLKRGQPVAWWFVFKFNTAEFPGCTTGAARQCIFGGEPQDYANQGYGQQYVFASSADASLKLGSDCAGDSTADPIGATFDQVYNGSYYYLIWNDQFYDDPKINGCTKECGAPWGHSKGMLAWDDSGAGFVMQVTTPSWPAAGSKEHPRATDGNTLGCVKDDNVKVSQHFFALRLTVADVIKVLNALANASVVTDPANPQIVRNGGPEHVRDLVDRLGKRSTSTKPINEMLSSGIELISKPSRLNVPPWQLVSAELGGVGLRAATWWANPKIYTTTDSSEVTCWDDSLGKPGPVEIATSGQWQGTRFGLTGGGGKDFNHAKIGVSTSGAEHYAIFGDENQQGAVTGSKCGSSQNGRGGVFYVIKDDVLFGAVANLIKGDTAPTAPTE